MSDEVAAVPRPWRLEVALRQDGRPREMLVLGADGRVVEHRKSGGYAPEAFERHVANARLYVAAVNAAEKI